MQNSSMRLLVTGGNGFVAGSVIQQAADDWELHVLSRGGTPPLRTSVRLHRFDPVSDTNLAELFDKARPQAVIHTAAIADIDFCEAHSTEARPVNVELTRALANLCALHGARFVFCSTDTIFDGEHAPYREDVPPGPLNCYAWTKVEAEKVVRKLGPQWVIARLSLVLGLPVLGAGNSFLARMLATLRAGRELEVPAREVRTPIDVITAGRALLELAASPFAGTIHLAGNDSLSRFEMAQRVAARFGLLPQLVIPADGTKISGRAPRPRDVSLDNSKAKAILRTPMLNLDDGLTLIIRNSETEPS